MPKVKDLSKKYSKLLINEEFCDFVLNESSIENQTLFCKNV